MHHVFVKIAFWNENNFGTKKHYIHTLPIHLQKEVLKYKYPEEQNQSLASKILLHQMLKTWGYDFEDLHYEQNHKPYIHHPNKPPFFSYSNAIQKAVLVWSWDIEVGIDIEVLDRKSDWQVFQSRLSPSVWKKILQETDPMKGFIKSWTHIEAIIKLKAIGLANHIQLVNYKDNEWFFENEKIYTQSLIDETHFITLASYEPFDYEIQRIDLNTFD